MLSRNTEIPDRSIIRGNKNIHFLYNLYCMSKFIQEEVLSGVDQLQKAQLFEHIH